MARRLKLSIGYDRDAEDPCDMDCSFRLHSFRSDHKNFCDREKLPYSRIGLQSKLRHGTAFTLDYYEHGLCRWSLSGDGPQCRWDTSRNSGLLVWPGKPSELRKTYEERRESAKAFLEEYTDWCNGLCYYFQLSTETDEPVDSCFGFIGDDSLIDGLSDVLRADDTVVIVPNAEIDFSHLRRQLKCRVLATSYFPTQPQPEYFI